MRRAGIGLVTVLALTAGGALVAPARAATPATPGRIDGLRGATRAIVVYSWGWRDTRVALRTCQRAKPGDRWRLVRGPMPGRIGYNGFSANRREGDGTTPAAIFGFVYGFGSQPNRVCAGYSYRGLRPNSCWSGRGPTTTAG
jgi:L,D-peptidoglycan transpeptidase YkuD (ErfK/YbiS/YcfS/YnhG family)